MNPRRTLLFITGVVRMNNTDAILDLWRAWQEMQGLSERSIVERAQCVRRLLRHCGEDPTAITAAAVMLFLNRPGLAPRTRWTYHQHVHAYSLWLVKAKLRADDPLADLPVPKKPTSSPRPVHDAQLTRILAAAKRRRTRTMILLAAYAGLRVHEIAKLHGDDVDLETETIRVVGKGGKDAVIPMHPLLVAEARHYPADNYWFPTSSGDTPHVTRQSVSRTIAAAMSRAGVTATPHALRHAYGTNLVGEGVDIRIVQELMRHSSIQSTQIYTQVSDLQRRAAIDKLRPPGAA